VLPLIEGLHFRLRAVPSKLTFMIVRGSIANSSQQAIVLWSRLVPRIRDGWMVTPRVLANHVSFGLC
jgi:hypothetical protein